MSNEKETPQTGQQIARIFEQPPDAFSFYSDMTQVMATGNEVVLQFYETIPGPPGGPKGQITNVRTRLKATITISKAHAQNIGTLLLERVEKK